MSWAMHIMSKCLSILLVQLYIGSPQEIWAGLHVTSLWGQSMGVIPALGFADNLYEGKNTSP